MTDHNDTHRDETAEPPNPERGGGASAPLDDREQTRKDVSYSPASEAETAAKQADPLPDSVDGEVDADQIRAVPGTGGPDDAGDVDVDPDELNLPRDAGPH